MRYTGQLGQLLLAVLDIIESEEPLNILPLLLPLFLVNQEQSENVNRKLVWIMKVYMVSWTKHV